MFEVGDKVTMTTDKSDKSEFRCFSEVIRTTKTQAIVVDTYNRDVMRFNRKTGKNTGRNSGSGKYATIILTTKTHEIIKQIVGTLDSIHWYKLLALDDAAIEDIYNVLAKYELYKEV